MNPGKGISSRRYYYCPDCDVSFTSFVAPSSAPTHRCRKKANQTKQLILKGTEHEHNYDPR